MRLPSAGACSRGDAVQTTLLGLAIAFIVALMAALIGPYFIDWNQFRPQFEAEAARIIGAPVRVGGKLDARLLPSPSLQLQRGRRQQARIELAADADLGADDPCRLRLELRPELIPVDEIRPNERGDQRNDEGNCQAEQRRLHGVSP